MSETTLTVTGMSCGGCEATVVDALESLEGVESVQADHEQDEVILEGSPDRSAVEAALAETAYELRA